MARPVFGVDVIPRGPRGDGRNHDGSAKVNPMLVYGSGPDGKRCGDCEHLFVRRYAKNYYKCELREDSASPRTDHRVRWPACARFEERHAET
jgi:hypothetical protein